MFRINKNIVSNGDLNPKECSAGGGGGGVTTNTQTHGHQTYMGRLALMVISPKIENFCPSLCPFLYHISQKLEELFT